MHSDEQRNWSELDQALVTQVEHHPAAFYEQLRIAQNELELAKDQLAAVKGLAPTRSNVTMHKTPGVVGDPVSWTNKERELSTLTLDQLRQGFREEQSPSYFVLIVHRLYYVRGSITEASQLIRDHPEIVADLPVPDRRLCERIRGLMALQRNIAKMLPPRAHGAAISCERDRVMYCAYSTPKYHSNGYSVRTKGVAAGLASAGRSVWVVGRPGYPWDTGGTDRPKPDPQRQVLEDEYATWIHLPGLNINHAAPDDYVQSGADAYVREAKIARPSVIHAASNYLNALPALLAARRLGIPFVYEVRGLWEVTEASAKPGWENSERYQQQAHFETFVCQHADQVLAITEEVRQELINRGVPDERITLLPNGVDTDDLLPLPKDPDYARRHKIPTDVPVIGFAGSFVEYEGLETLVEAAGVLRDRGLEFCVALAGAGGVYNSLKNRVAELDLDTHVKLIGRRPSTEIPVFLSTVDVVCCPRLSLPVTEMVSPLKPLEAFAAAKPVVLSDVSPHRELVGETQSIDGLRMGERGALHQPGDAESLANHLEYLITRPAVVGDMGRRGRVWARHLRDWTRLGRQAANQHITAVRTNKAAAIKGPALPDLKVAIIADEFTTETLRPSVNLIVLSGDDFEHQLRRETPDLLFLESAWNGNGGQWHRSVGFYSAEENKRLARVFDICHELGIPTVFWNKEDPIHFQRFAPTAVLCDHVFTTDANVIGNYLEHARMTADSQVTTAAAQSFYAQPRIHNPLPGSMPAEPTVSYAGTYYGQRYAERSAQLSALLRTARPYGLTIYDRQLALANSPYHFPREFKHSVKGSLPYSKVLDSYKAHTANLNVNSVVDSPTMFSRRVVEIAASGGVVLSAASRGLSETFGDLIPATDDPDKWSAWLSMWSRDADARRREAWLQLRAVARSHSADAALTVMARTAGISVGGPESPSWAAELDAAQAHAQVEQVLMQSLRPSAVAWNGTLTDPTAQQRLETAGIRIIANDATCDDVDWWGVLPPQVSRTWAEDLLRASQWGDWSSLRSRHATETDPPLGLVAVEPLAEPTGFIKADGSWSGSAADALRCAQQSGTESLTLLEDSSSQSLSPTADTGQGRGGDSPGEDVTLLVAGHDLKFLRTWMQHQRETGRNVLVDQWHNHTEHDLDQSVELLARADIIFCEWGLGNAVWYSQNVQTDQRLIVRVHAQELRGPYLHRINHDAVLVYVFVSELMRQAAISSHGLPAEKCVVIPNAVDIPAKPTEDHVGAKTLGLVGSVPQSKRLDRAIDLLEHLLAEDPDFTLRVKGKRVQDYPWMMNRPLELQWYQGCQERIDNLRSQYGRDVVVFDPHGDDMQQWFQGIGFAISVSDHESFHLTLPDGAVCGAAPVSLAWPGADVIYPADWLFPTVDDMASRVLALAAESDAYRSFRREAAAYVAENMAAQSVFASLDQLISVRAAAESTGSPVNADAVPTPAPDTERVVGILRQALSEANAQQQRLTEVLAMRVRELGNLRTSYKRQRDALQKKVWWLESEWSTNKDNAKKRQDAQQRKIWWLESEWSTNKTAAKQKLDAQQRKIWRLESELRKATERAREAEDQLREQTSRYSALKGSPLGRLQRKYWNLRRR